MAAKKTPAVKPKRVERNIRFYQVTAQDPNGLPLDNKALFGQLHKHSRSPTVYMNAGTAAELSIHIDRINPICGVLAATRTDNLPSFDQTNQYQPLNLPTTARGVVEPTHFVAFDNGVLACESNQFGPRANRIVNFFESHKLTLGTRVQLKPLVDETQWERLQKISNLRRFTITLQRAGLPILQKYLDHTGPAAAAKLADELADSTEITFGAQNESRSRAGFASKFINRFRDSNNPDELLAYCLDFTVTGINEATGAVDEVDLIREFVQEKVVAYTVSNAVKAIDANRIWSAIIDAHKHHAANLTPAK